MHYDSDMNAAQTTMNLKTAKAPRTCNRFPLIWRAIHGCEGRTRQWHYVSDYRGGREPEFVCAACATAKVAADDAFKAGGSPGHQDHLRAEQDRAGVVNYRNAGCAVVDGRPVVTSPGWV